MEDQNPGLDSAREGAEDLELELNPNIPEVTPKEEEDPVPGDDPLDDIQDEVARAQAKKDRAIARRKAKAPTDVPVTELPKPKEEFLTKSDFYKSNERKAIREATADPEIKAIWNEVVPFYTPRRGKETAEDIAEDIRDAITIYRSRNPVTPTDDSARELTVTPVVKTEGGKTEKVTPKVPAPPNFPTTSKTEEWYKPSPK